MKYVLREAEGLPLPSMRPRTIEVPLRSGKVIVRVGIRRSGKTFLLLDVIRRLQAMGVDRGQIVANKVSIAPRGPLRACRAGFPPALAVPHP